MKYCVTVSELIVDDDNLIRADGIVMGRRVRVNGQTYLELRDHNQLRTRQRGRTIVRIPFDILMRLDNI